MSGRNRSPSLLILCVIIAIVPQSWAMQDPVDCGHYEWGDFFCGTGGDNVLNKNPHGTRPASNAG